MYTRPISEIIESIKALKGVKTDGEVAALLFMEPSNLTGHKHRNSVPLENVITFCQKEHISLDSMLSGEEGVKIENWPEFFLNHIRRAGMRNEEHLRIIIGQIENAYYYNQESEATTRWAANLARAFILTAKNITFSKTGSFFSPVFKKRSSLTGYLRFFGTHWPFNIKIEQPADIEKFLELAELSIGNYENREKINGKIPYQISTCFSFLLRYNSAFSIRDEIFQEIKRLLEPWCFTVAQKSLHKELPSEVSPIILSDEKTPKTSIEISGGTVNFHALLDPGRGQFSCLFSFEKGSIACSIRSLVSLLNLRKKITSYDFYVEGDAWVLSRRLDTGAYIRRDLYSYSPSKEEMEDFLTLIKSVEQREEIKTEIDRAVIETYGAL